MDQDVSFDFSGQVGLVTGAAQGLGKTIVETLTAGGAKVIAVDINETALAGNYESHPLKDQVVCCPGDITNESFVNQMMDLCCSQADQFSILVNNAGILQRGSLLDITPADWDHMMSVNVKAMFLGIRAAVPLMQQNKYGRIVNVSSDAGKCVSTLGGCHYTASKAAVLGLTRHLGMELASDGILVNAVCPGLVDTPMSRTSTQRAEWDSICDRLPQKRGNTTQEIAAGVAFLCSSSCSAFVGAAVDVNGGSYFC